MIGCPVAAACFDACWPGELSQHPMCPHAAHRRRWNHQSFGDARHSTHPSPLGFEARLKPRRSFFIFDLSFSMLPALQRVSSHQQDLPDAALLCGRLSLARFTEWQGLANRDYQLAISHRLGHELECVPVEFREYRHHLYRRVLRRVLRCPENRSKYSTRLDLDDQLLGGFSSDGIRHRIEWRKIRNRAVVVGCDHLIRADSLRLILLLLQDPCDHSGSPFLCSEYRRTPNTSSGAYNHDRLARLDTRGGTELVASGRRQGQRRCPDQIEPLGNLR